MKAWFLQKTMAEQHILLSFCWVILLILLYAFLYLPINRSNSQLQTRIDSYQTDLGNMQAMANQLKLLSGSNKRTVSTAFNKSRVMTLIEQSAKQQQLKIVQIRPLNNNHLVVLLDNTLFNDSLRWLNSLQKNYPVTVEKFSATNNQGSTNMQITLSY
ncbi:MAG: general secretion pathway protein M [Methyloprofundus sp.]|nr:MAG: general secretion pathway protein M [Methyloprofundus sp.]